MATAASRAGALHAQQKGYPAGGVRFDLGVIAVSAWLIGGLFVDGWAHFHGMVDDSFFTPWHAVFYSGFMAVALFLGINQWRNIAKGYAFWRALPEGYMLSLVGAAIFAVGGVGDLIWHTLFGIEVDTEALLSPTHLLLATGMVLIVSGPLRAAWRRIPAGQAGGWRVFLPMLLSVTLLLAVLSFFTSYANPFVSVYATHITQSADTPAEIYMMNADGTGQTRLTMAPGRYAWAGAWSPDGSRIVYLAGDMDAGEQGDLYVMKVDGTEVTSLTTMEGEEYTPSWSPDGESVVFINRNAVQSDVYVVSADGGDPTRLTESADDEYQPVWSSDGAQIAVTIARGENYQVYSMGADGSRLTPLTTESLNWGTSWSPDSAQIAFASLRDGNAEIYVMDADGGNQTRLTTSPDSEDVAPSWSEDGIVFTSWRDGHADLYHMNADGSNITNLTYSALDDDNAAWSPDGSKILYTVSAGAGGDDVDVVGLGIGSILIQSALMMGLVLLITRQWVLPFGALALVFTLATGLISVLADQYALVLVALIGGLIGDGLVRWLKPASATPERYYLFGFLVPVIFYALYFGALQLVVGIGWTIHVWAGAIFLAGVVGLLLSALVIWVQESRTSPRTA